MKYLQNSWYAAALSDEVSGDALFNRKILGLSVLIYRRQEGEAVALHNRCPHRFAPLHLGKKVGDEVVCAYHGLKFDCTGRCVESPHGDGKIPKAAVVRSFPLVERDGFLWIWPGDAAVADAALIPDLSMLTQASPNAIGYGYMHMPANYEIVVDNIMDLSHVDHVHGPLLNTAGKLSPQTPDVIEQLSTVTIRWEWQQHPPMGLFAPFLPEPQAQAEQFAEVTWSAPATMKLTVGAVQGSRDYDRGLISWDQHILTPETETTCHYFFATRRNWLVDDAAFNKLKLDGQIDAFSNEDKPLIAAIQEEMATPDLWSLKPVLLNCDSAAVRTRRVLRKLIQAESGDEVPVKLQQQA